ncbi:LLM class flavin-dependent oxidoreductase [Cryptosporangium arvum]|uniref:Flavin-dependent oxidoreductase, F420-dependent methylene-tetrahydromethanopterin reductase n=1 Tax=Cryptosporangium arvum DSM 44712 TaxID=927661 RepID=A0A010YPX8_9ACTN|nr:LLM class flavin-dependent oxidoreductase [Cryptosporangium arvum]EXG82235.1 flavin-dependent oxidoreductase, F420-dependent methylene-tetrahydromethanopterin reductase [Cryptosporangium arvum DSM 44712]
MLNNLLRFGLSLDPDAARADDAVRLAAAAEEAGLDYLAVQDHPYQAGHLDSWTWLTHLAARTSRIGLLTDVADLQLRPPAMLAKAALTFSRLHHGRLALGVGGGAFPDGIAAMGGTRRSNSDMVAYTEEAFQVLRPALAGDFVRLHGAHHRIEGYQAGPAPAGPVPVWLGAQGPKMLAVTGGYADGWISPLNIYVKPDEVPAKQKIIDEAARAAGRDPAAISRIYNVIGWIGSDRRAPGLSGDVEQWVDTLADWSTRLGFDTFIFWPVAQPQAQLELFAGEVVPALRKRVSR